MTAIELSSDVGLAAVFLVTANLCLGLLIAVRYSPVRRWPHRHVNIFAFHNWTAYLALTATLLHPVVLLFSSQVRFRLLDVVLPLWSPQQPLENTLGAMALYVLVVVVLTSYWRHILGRPRWKRLHYLVYPAAALLFAHGLLTDPELKNQPVDWFDGEKIFIQLCFVCVTGFALWAWRYRVSKERRERALHLGRYHSLEPPVVSAVATLPPE